MYTPKNWKLEESEQSTCQYVLLRSSDRQYYVQGYGETESEALTMAKSKIKSGNLESSHPWKGGE